MNRAFVALVGAFAVGSVAGCQEPPTAGSTPAEAQVVKAALNASPKTSDFIFEAQNSIVLHSSPLTVNGGDVGARGTGTVGPFLSGGVAIDIASGAKVQTTRNVIADSIKLNSGIVVGALQTNRLVNPTSGTHGAVTALVPLPALPAAAAVTPGTQNLNVTGTTTSNPGKFLTVSLGSKAVWRLAAGTYEMKDLTVGSNGRIEAMGPVQIRVANRLSLGTCFFVGAKSGVTLTAKDIRIEVSGKNGTDGALASTPKAAALGSDGNVRALILVPNGTLSFASGVTAKGAFMARDIDVGSSSCAYTYEDGFPNTATCTAQSCNDNNACTNDVCGTNGVCTHTNVAAGTSCGDGNACNGAETCTASGVCQAGTPVTCTASDQCHTAGTCNSATGVCSNPSKADGTTCSDGDACTTAEACHAGVCNGGTAKTCAASDQCHAAGTCDPSSGVCSNPTKPNGTTCSDGNACTLADSCQAGTCTGASPVTCVAVDQCHVAGLCDATSGACTNPAKPDGTTCSDGDACTTAEACHAGACNGGTQKTCTAQDQCHLPGSCSPTTGVCSNPTKPEGTGCNDGDACSIGDRCQIGICTPQSIVTCSASDQCHAAGTCDKNTGTCTSPAKPDGTTCSDGDACTTAEACHAGVCGGGTAKVCTAQDQCHVAGTCDAATGACTNPIQTDGTTCNDGDACTTAEACHAGTCDGGTAKTCTASDQCHVAGTCGATTGVCSNPTKTDGVTCDDGDACTTAEACHAGSCNGGAAKVCTASDQCHVAGTCNPTSGACTNPSTPNGTTCDDGNPSTSGDQCASGVCAGTGGDSCPPPDQCRVAGKRDPATGNCVYPFKLEGTVCNDGNPATDSDQCAAGVCVGHRRDANCQNDYVECDDGNPCTEYDSCYNGRCNGSPIVCATEGFSCAGYCDPATGACSVGPAPDGTQCNDDSACTANDVCTAGVCGGAGTCSGEVMVSGPSLAGSFDASLSMTMTADHPVMHPLEKLGMTAKVTFSGGSFNTYGVLELANNSPSEYVVPGYSATIEYLSAVSHDWVPLARKAYDATGQVLPPTAPTELSFIAYGQYDPGVIYPGYPGYGAAGTLIPSGKTGHFYLQSYVTLPTAALAILGDPAQALDVRHAVRIDPGPGLPSGAEIVTSFDLAVGTELAVTNLRPQLAGYGTPTPTTPPVVDHLPLGATVTVTGSVEIPGVKPYSDFNNDYYYTSYLTSLANNAAYLTGSASAEGPSVGHGAGASALPITVPVAIPLLKPALSGREEVPVGFQITYALTLANQGREPATDIAIENFVYRPGQANEYKVEPATITAPTSVDAGQTVQGTLVYQSREGYDSSLTFFYARTTWKDAFGNVYGPVQGDSRNAWFIAPVPLGVLSLAGETTGPLPVEEVVNYAATAQTPQGLPAVGVDVKLTVTGANAQVMSATTDAAGIAHFQLQGRHGGVDTVVATATITTGPLDSNNQRVYWSAPFGTPCTSPDVPLDVVIAIDTSSSMEGPNLEAAKAAAHSFLDTMDLSRDQLGIVSFGAFGGLNVGLTSDFVRAGDGIDSVFPGGGWINPTSIGAGLDAALNEITSSRHRPTATPIIVFVSDGGNSWGDPEPALARLAASGIRTFAFALGSDIDVATLKRIASSRNELFYVPGGNELTWLYSALRADICRNQVPLVHAGGNEGVYGVRLPHPLPLRGEVHDDGPIALTTSEWTVVSGPAPVTFLDASSPETTALFSEPGTYVLRLTGSDGTFTGSDDATITVDPEPSLVGASLVATLGTPGPLVVGSPETVLATLTDAGGHPISDYAVQVTVTGPNATTATVLTNASGVATFAYTGSTVGTDVLTATALAESPLASAPVSLAWTGLDVPTVATQGWIGSPLSQATVTDLTPITIGAGVTLTEGTLTFWPASAPDRVRTLATAISGGPGSTLATLDTTVLANGPYVVKLDAKNDVGHSQVSLIGLTVGGEYKPGRVVVEVKDFEMPVAGMPITLGRRYDSLEKDNVGEFGNGWSLLIGHPRLEVDAARNVTITMPGGRRSTFYFTPTFPSVGPVVLGFFLLPKYSPEPGLYGSLTADGCSVLAFNPYADVPNPTCFGAFDPSELAYAPTTYKYTDPFGTVFTMGASGELRSIKDRQQNELTFTHDGIVSNTGRVLTFERDALNRITKAISPPLDAGNGKIVHQYEYAAATGDLSKVYFPDNTNALYTYGDDHRLLTAKDNNGNLARTSTYDTAGHLLSDKDALGNVTSYAYDLAAHKTTITNPDLGTVEQTFDNRGFLLKEVDPLGRKTEHTYDANKNELTQKNALGEVRTFTYDAQGNQMSNTNARGEATRKTFNDVGLPLSKTDPTGHTLRTEYEVSSAVPKRVTDELATISMITSSEHGSPTTMTDAAGNTSFFAYDTFGSMTMKTDRLGRTTRYAFDGAGRQTSLTPPRGGATVYYYTNRGSLTFVDTPTGIFAQSGFRYAFDGNLNLAYDESHVGRRTNRTYDALNHLTKVDRDDSTTVSYTRDFRGNPLTMKDESNRTTTYEYDKVGQLKKTKFADGTFKTRDYDSLGRLAKETDERGGETSYEYESGCDCADRPTKVTDALGRTTITTYDAAGRRSSVTDPAGHTTSFAYDVRGRLTKTTFADGTFERDVYDTRNRRTSHTDQTGAVTAFEYDAAGQLITVTDPLSNATHYAYDANGNLASVTDANNHTTTYDYDLKNRKIKRTLPNGASESFVYDLFDEVISQVDFRGKTTTSTYDRRGRLLTKVPDPTLGEPTVTLTYNPAGTRAKMVDASGTTTYTYDTRNRMLTKSTQAGTLTYTFDAAGNVGTVRSSNANGTSVDYAWDAANQLVSVTDNRAGGVTTSAYTATGRPSSLIQPTGIAASYQYDARDRVTSLAWQRGADPAVGRWSYGFNARGQRTSVTNVANRQIAYGYDASARLVSETITNDPQSAGNGEVSYTLDGVGNRLTRTSALAALGAQSFTYDGNNQIAADSYDGNGNTTSSDGHTFVYDFENRLVSKDAGAVTVVYDGDGSRVAKTVGGVTTRFLVDDLSPTGYSQVLEEVSGGTVQVAYTYGTKVVSQRRGTASYYGYDAHGNIAFLTDATGTVTDTYEYDAWGSLLGRTGTTVNTRLYTGEELDPDLGFIYLRARHYDPRRGRFASADTMPGTPERPVTFNPYLYADGDPADGLDPSGHATAAEYAIIVTGIAAGGILTWYGHNVTNQNWFDYCVWGSGGFATLAGAALASGGAGLAIALVFAALCVEFDFGMRAGNPKK